MCYMGCINFGAKIVEYNHFLVNRTSGFTWYALCTFFLDVLGFKKRLSKLSQYDSERFISSLSSLLYKVWEEKGFQDSKEISGYIVSDSIIV